MANVLLIYPQQIGMKLSPSTFLKKMGAYSPPLGLLYLARVLERSGNTVEIVDYNAEQFNKSELERKVISNDLIGISVTTQSLEFTSDLIQTIEEINQHKPIILGGSHCILNKEKTLHDFDVEVSVLGEAEYIIDDIVQGIYNEEKLSNIPNIVYRNGEKIVVNPGNTQINNLDDISFPARHLVEKYDYGYVNDVKLFRGKTTAICTSRGCPFHCNFCSVVSLFPGYYQRSAENVMAEINEIVNDGYKTVIIVDDNFMVDTKRLIKILEHIIRHDFDLNLIVNGARVDSGDEEIFKLMKKGDAHIKLEVPLASKADTFFLQGNLNRMDFSAFNSMTRSLFGVAIKKGKGEVDNIRMHGNAENVTGELIFPFRKLKIQLINPRTGERGGIGDGIMTFLANEILLRSNNPRFLRKIRIGTVYAPRDPRRSIFNYIWKGILSGIESTLGYSDKEQRQQRRELRKKQRNED